MCLFFLFFVLKKFQFFSYAVDEPEISYNPCSENLSPGTDDAEVLTEPNSEIRFDAHLLCVLWEKQY